MSLRPGAGSRAGTPRHFLVNGNEDHLGLIVGRTAKKKGQRRPSYMPAGSVVVRPPAAGSEMPQDRLEVPGRSASRQAEVPLAVVAPGLSQGRATTPGPASARQPVWSSRATRWASWCWGATRSCTARRPASPRRSAKIAAPALGLLRRPRWRPATRQRPAQRRATSTARSTGPVLALAGPPPSTRPPRPARRIELQLLRTQERELRGQCPLTSSGNRRCAKRNVPERRAPTTGGRWPLAVGGGPKARS